MKALLLKDYYTLGKSLRLLIFIMVLWSVIPAPFLNMFAVIYGAMIPYSAMACDQQSRWNVYARMLPCREKEVVLSRYVLGWICTAAGGVTMFVLQNLLSLFFSRQGFNYFYRIEFPVYIYRQKFLCDHHKFFQHAV